MKRLINVLNSNNIKYDEEILLKVINYSECILKDSVKYTKQLTIIHSIDVAIEVAKYKFDITAIYASVLHEAGRKETFDYKYIQKLCGKDTVKIIKAIIKLSYLSYINEENVDTDKLRNMFLEVASDMRVIIIKLCDRICNLRHIEKTDKFLASKIARETTNIYAPIAHRLGISNIRGEMEDISFKVLNPKQYNYIKDKIESTNKERQSYINKRIREIKDKLLKYDIKCEIFGRPKHIYSIYKKMQKKECDVYDIFDLLAIRIIVSSVKDCYTALGTVHEQYKPMPHRFKDYIAVPKINGYQSLHTTVFGEKNKPFEVQIRTWDMHAYAEYGVATHFVYKEKKTFLSKIEQKILWIRQTMELQKELTSSNLASFKGEVFGEEVFVFTPKGEIKALPSGATVIDFAYQIHQKVAESMIGAKINSRIVPLTTKLKNTDVINIITSNSSSGPSLDWISHVKTTSAKNKIMGYLKKQGTKVNIQKGKELFEKEIKKLKYDAHDLMKHIDLLLKDLNFKSQDVLYENIGFGIITVTKVINKLKEIYQKENNEFFPEIKKITTKTDLAVEVEGIDNCLVKFSKCCSPIMGDEIIGYITNGSGVSIHRADCPNMRDKLSKRINVKWKNNKNAEFEVKLNILSNDRDNLIVDIFKVTNDSKIKVLKINTILENKKVQIELNISVNNIDSLNKLIRKIKKIDSIFEVKRRK